MTSPVAAVVGAGASAAGGIFGAIGAAQTGAANAAMYNYKAGVALMNQKINLQNAAWATDAGEVSAEEKGLAAGQAIGQTKAQQSASGFDVNTGSGASARTAQTQAAEFDQNIVRFDAAKSAYGYETKAATDVAEANLDQFSATAALQASKINVISSILGGVSGVAAKWSQASQIGIGSSGGSGDNPYYGPLDSQSA